MAFTDWSTTAGDNDDADANINWAEGQAPSTVNGSARAMMAALKTSFGHFVNVLDYIPANLHAGIAAGSDSTDLQSYLQLALNTARYIWIPNGTYNIGGVLDVQSNSVIQFESWDAIIQYDCTLDQEVDILRVSAKSNVVIRGGKLRGTGADATPGNGCLAIRTGSTFVYVTGMEIHGHNSGMAIEDPSTDCWVIGNYIHDQARHAIRQIGKARCYWRYNILKDSGQQLVAFNPPNSGSVTDIWFEHNYLELGAAYEFIIVSQVTTQTHERLHFNYNTAVDTGSAKAFFNSNARAVINSQFKGNALSGGYVCLELYLCEDCDIEGNFAEECEEGAYVLLGSQNNRIRGNTAKNCDQAAATASLGGIVLRDSGATGSTGNLIEGNICYDDQGTKTQNYGLNLQGTSSKRNIVGVNDFDGNKTAPISGATTATRIEDSKYKRRYIVSAFDDFLGDVISDQWGSQVGSDPQCVAPAIQTAARGLIRMTTGNDGAVDMATNGVQLESALNWQASLGGLVFEARVTVSGFSVAWFVGFTDQVGTLEMPFTLGASDTLTANATNAVGWLADTGADTDNWWLVGVAGGTPATKQDTGSPPVAGTYEILRVEVTTAGVATFYRNGVQVGTAMTAAVTAATPLTPVIAAFARTAVSRNIDVDYILVEGAR